MDVYPNTTSSHLSDCSGAQNEIFCFNIESTFGRKDTLLIIRGPDTLSEALEIILIHLREVRKHSSSNRCVSLQHRPTLSGRSGTHNWLFYLKFEHSFGRKDTVLTMRASDTLPEALKNNPIHEGKVMKHSSSNGCTSLRHSITFPRLIYCSRPRIVLLLFAI